MEIPPNPPTYSFGNESGKKKIKILLGSNFINSEKEFVTISDLDSDFYTKVAISQKNEEKSSHMFSSGMFE